MRVLIIDNLSSGLKNGAIHDFNRIFARDGDELILRSTAGNTPIAALLYDAPTFDLVVASGGDATVSAVAYELRNSNLPILLFPAGTANLLAVNLATPEEPSTLACMAREPHTECYDLGELSFEQEGVARTQGFAVIAGAGYDATIMRRAERMKDLLGPMAYLAAAASEPNPTVAHFCLTLDNDEVWEVDGIAVLIINFAQIFPDLSITHENDGADGLFEVVVVKKQHTFELLPALFAAFLDSVGNFPDRADALESRRAASVTVASEPPLRLQFDGETPAATTPFEARVLPGAARFVVA